MQAIILAGGKGRRLYPFTEEIPKPLVKINEEPIIAHLLKQMERCGVTNVTIAVHHMAEQIQQVIGDGSQFNLNIQYSYEEKELSTVAPLKLINSLEENFIVANGDILTDLDFSDLMKNHKEKNKAITVAVTKRRHHIDYGVIETDENANIISFIEKPTTDYLVSCGMYVFSKSILDKVPENKLFGFDDLMHLLLKQKIAINSYLFENFWYDIGRPADYEKAQVEFKKYFDKNN